MSSKFTVVRKLACCLQILLQLNTRQVFDNIYPVCDFSSTGLDLVKYSLIINTKQASAIKPELAELEKRWDLDAIWPKKNVTILKYINCILLTLRL